jgi:hypothetical protein
MRESGAALLQLDYLNRTGLVWLQVGLSPRRFWSYRIWSACQHSERADPSERTESALYKYSYAVPVRVFLLDLL